MVVRPCLTRLDFIIARGFLGASAQELVYLPDQFQNQTSRACSRQEVFQFYVLEEAWRVVQASYQLPSLRFYSVRVLINFPSCRSFSSYKKGVLSGNAFPVTITVRKGWYYSGSQGDARMPSFLERVIPSGVAGLRCVGRTLTSCK